MGDRHIEWVWVFNVRDQASDSRDGSAAHSTLLPERDGDGLRGHGMISIMKRAKKRKYSRIHSDLVPVN